MTSVTPSEASFILVGPETSQVLNDRVAATEVSPQQSTSPSSDSEVSSRSVMEVDLYAKGQFQPKKHPSSDASYTAGSTPSYAHDWSPAGVGGRLQTHGRHFLDAYGRAPVSPGGSPRASVEAEKMGFDFCGIYDQEYLDYLRNILTLLPFYGITAFVSLHQDVWSRYSGGSGAPAWTLEMIGFDLHALEESGAAWLLGVKGGGHVEAERGIWPCGYQKLSAATMATCFWAGDTFAPKLRVKSKDGKETSVQQFLQNAYLDMWEVVARAVGDLEGVMGFELMNEPHRGYIDLPSLHEFDYNTDLHLSHVPSALQSFLLGSGYPATVGHWTRSFPMPTRLTSQSVLNSASRKAWRLDGPTGGKCIWEMHGVWGYDVQKQEGIVLRENYFVKDPMTGKKVDWYTDFYYPFINQWTNRVRSASSSEKMVFLEPIPNEFCPSSWTAERQPTNMVYAPHWYCLNTLFSKAYGEFSVNVQGLSRGMFPLRAFYWGHNGARDNFFLQIRNIVEAGYKSLGEKPVIIGECGVPMDMNKREAFRTNNFKWQRRMMDAMITGLERSLVGFTLWNYNPDNDDANGDNWNGENFSWFSRSRSLPASELSFDQNSDTLDKGGRILESLVRPYPAKTAGVPIRFEYEMTTGTFIYDWAVPLTGPPPFNDPYLESKSWRVGFPPLHSHPAITARETEIFVPSMLARGRKMIVRGLGSNDQYVYDEDRQTLFILVDKMWPARIHSVTVSFDPPCDLFVVNSFWTDFKGWILAVLIALVAIVYRLFA
ncbi:hypothetical protein EW146_g3534 [Bondarzewia mesenterica]|uniref:Glycoside hydrolase family 5 C-terminal domain-containing protein n=1 Tax=Bondarzewia mesenterica TaxID=1095465 RepID=A0A4S4LXR1_9AGAM|nr:hypothetical protein EW146_g3534 [Bondarzewia mesenterica]